MAVTEPSMLDRDAPPKRRLSRAEQRELTRERMLDAAADVFNRLGYHGASLDAVAEAAGYTKGAVYSNFATKGDLFLALMQRQAVGQARSQGEAIMALPFEELGEYAGRALFDQIRSQETWDLLQIEFWLAAMRDPALRETMACGAAEMWAELGDRLDSKFAQADHEIPFTGVEFAKLINALGTGLLISLYIDPTYIKPELFGRATRVLLGLRAEGAPAEQAAALPGEPPTSG